MWTVNFQMFKLDLEKAEESEIKSPTSIGSSKKQKSIRRTPISVLLTMPKLWQCESQQTVENSSRDGNIRPPDLPPEKSAGLDEAQIESMLQGEISITSDMQMTTPLWEKVKKN